MADRDQKPRGPRSPGVDAGRSSRPGSAKPYAKGYAKRGGPGDRPGGHSGGHQGGFKARPPEDVETPHRNREPAGYAVRALAVRLVSSVVDRRRALDDTLSAEFAGAAAAMEARDRGLARLIAATVLRRKGELDAVISNFLERPLPADRGLLDTILECAAAQLLVLEIPPHAVINIAVEQCRHDRGARRFDRLANAVLRRVSEHGSAMLEKSAGPRLDVPDWLWSRWQNDYGEETAARISEASLREAPLDITPRTPSEGALWNERLGGRLLPTGTIRVIDPEARVEALPGFEEGAWWVQDAAAALPAHLLGEIAGKRVADLCAAPGGKTAQLAAAGADVTAADASKERLLRVHQNLARLKLDAEVVTADVTAWKSETPFDAVLLDAPCTATGTIRRHPDILYLKRQTDLGPLVELQARMLDNAGTLLAPGGTLVYCTCSLEADEGENQVARFLDRNPSFARLPIIPGDASIEAAWITPAGDLRVLPFHSPGGDLATGGMDGFYAARLVKASTT